MMMSGPVPDWIAEVMRACRSLALMVSTLSVMPVAFWHSCMIWPLSSMSEAGTKSAQRSQWTVVPCAKAGTRPAAATAARPPVCAATALDADSFRSLRRVMRVMIPPGVSDRVLGRTLAQAEASFFQAGASRPERPAECSRARRQARIHGFNANRSPIRGGRRARGVPSKGDRRRRAGAPLAKHGDFPSKRRDCRILTQPQTVICGDCLDPGPGLHRHPLVHSGWQSRPNTLGSNGPNQAFRGGLG